MGTTGTRLLSVEQVSALRRAAANSGVYGVRELCDSNETLRSEVERLRAALTELLEVAPDCNPQDPDIVALGEERCPPGHRNECGVCYAVRMAQDALKEADRG